MGYTDEFEDLMENCEIGDFTEFMLSEEEMEKGKQERKAQVKKDTEELRGLMKEVEQLRKDGKNIPNKIIRRVKQLSSDQLVLIAAMKDEDVDDLVEMEMGEPKKQEKGQHTDQTAEMIDVLKKALDSDDPMAELERLTSVEN